MSLEYIYQQLEQNYSANSDLSDFLNASTDMQGALYQKVLFLAGEQDTCAQAIIARIKKESLPLITEFTLQIEQQRYNLAQANTLYQDFLYQTALKQAAQQESNKLLFDLQGRLIYELSLSSQQQDQIISLIEDSLGLQTQGNSQERLKILLGGRTPTTTTLCSLDLTGNAPFNTKEAYQLLYSQYISLYGSKVAAIPNHQRGSIVPSLEETYAHLSLMVSTYQRLCSSDIIDWSKIRQKAAQQTQALVIELYHHAQKKVLASDDTINIKELNKILGNSRAHLAHEAKKIIVKELTDQLKNQDYKRDDILFFMQNLCQKMDKKYTFTKQTATGYDYLHTADYLQQSMLISGTNDSAHNKLRIQGDDVEDQLAYRKITYAYKDHDGTLLPTNKVNARIPSPALVFNKNMSATEIKNDLKDKYRFLYQQICTMRGGKTGPVIEHLFTSFHSNAYEHSVAEKNNRQRTTALYMIQAMHEFNAQQYTNTEEVANFLYVQNIGTNRHTYNLGYRTERSLLDFSGSLELDDITLGAEMALFFTLQEQSINYSDETKQLIMKINRHITHTYKQFLQQPEHVREPYFAHSAFGKKLINQLPVFKKEIQLQLHNELNSSQQSDHLPTLISHALAKMVATNQHWDKRYGQLTQTLSMYIESAAVGGCKSGNERNQDVMARYSLLTSIHERVKHNQSHDAFKDLQEHEVHIYKELTAYIRGTQPNPDKLRAAIALSVRESTLHGGIAAISREDQGGAAKISSFSWLQDIKNPYIQRGMTILGALIALITFPLLVIPAVRTFWIDQLIDTNNAADREMQLDAATAATTQAHKGQDKKTRQAITEVLNADPLFKTHPLTVKERIELKQEDLKLEINQYRHVPITQQEPEQTGTYQSILHTLNTERPSRSHHSHLKTPSQPRPPATTSDAQNTQAPPTDEIKSTFNGSSY